MANHLVQSVLSLGFSIAVILCIVALVARNGYLEDDELMNTKAVYIICKPTEYKDACKKALSDVAKNSSATKKDYIFTPFYTVLKELEKASDKASSADLKNCEKLLGDAIEELNQVLKVATKTKIATLGEQADPILVWVTAIRAYQTTCVEEIQDGDDRKYMKQALEDANKHTFNLEKILYNIADILMEFGVDMGHFHLSATGPRRLLEEEEEEEGAVGPTWFSAADRSLLGGGGGDDDEDEEDEKHKAGMFKKHTSQDYFKTPEPEAYKKGSTLDPKVVVEPNVVVDQDGNGDYRTIKQALDAYPSNHKGRYVIYVKAGVYDEGQIIVNKNQCNVYMYGDGRDKTIITGDLGQGTGTTQSQTATFVAQGERFMAKGIGFRNTYGNEGAAVAFRSQAPHTIMVQCSFEGYQKTLYYHAHDQFYKNCSVSGTVDFITGSGRAFFQDCKIYVRKPESGQSCYITADGQMKHVEAGGVVLQRCKIKAAKELEPVKDQVKSYLGRPWKAESTAVVMQTDIGDLIHPEGWSKWEESSEGKDNYKTCMFREYKNKGPGSNTENRVKWKGFKVIKDKTYAGHFTPGPFMDAKCWLPNAGLKVEKGFKY